MIALVGVCCTDVLFAARGKLGQREVAVKRLQFDAGDAGDEATKQTKTIDREVKHLIKLDSHANVIK